MPESAFAEPLWAQEPRRIISDLWNISYEKNKRNTHCNLWGWIYVSLGGMNKNFREHHG